MYQLFLNKNSCDRYSYHYLVISNRSTQRNLLWQECFYIVFDFCPKKRVTSQLYNSLISLQFPHFPTIPTFPHCPISNFNNINPFLQTRKLRLLAFIIQKVAIKLVLEATPVESQFLNTVCYICQKRFLHISLYMYTME